MSWEIRQGDALERLREMPDESVQCCVTSPPYFGLRDYNLPPTDWPEVVYALPGGEITVPPMTCCLGLEETPEQFIGHLVLIYREIGRVLRADGTAWVNLGDSYNSGGAARREPGRGTFGKHDWMGGSVVRAIAPDLKPKDLLMVPALVALALRSDGWYLRRDIIWSKPNPMPESVTDRPTSAHEYLFLLTKSARYFYDAEAIREQGVWAGQNRSDRGPRESHVPGTAPHRGLRNDKQRGHDRRHDGFNDRWDSMSKDEQQALGRNRRSVWTIATRPFPEAHFATFPPDLVEPCILAGTPPKVCGECGAPWVRQTERRPGYAGNSAKAGRDPAEIDAGGKGQYPGNHKNLKAGPVVDARTSAQLTLSPQASPVKTSARSDEEPGSPASGRVFGRRSRGSFANFDPGTSSWRTSRGSGLSDSTEYSGTWPRAGMTRSGIAYPLRPSAPRTKGTGSGWWPTPHGMPKRGQNRRPGPSGNELGRAVLKAERERLGLQPRAKVTGSLNPQWVEWLMGFPPGWVTSISSPPSATPSSRRLPSGSAGGSSSTKEAA